MISWSGFSSMAPKAARWIEVRNGHGITRIGANKERQQGYGDWEFEVQDPNGYILVFSELIE